MTSSSDHGNGSDNLSNADGTTPSQELHPPDLSVWDWSGRGSHVDFVKSDVFPLEQGRWLGYGKNGHVYETKCRGVTLAWKQRYCRHKITQNELREIDILKKLNHKHIVMLVGTYTRLNFLGLLLWPVAVCDLGTFFDDLETLRHPRTGLEDDDDIISDRMGALNLLSYGDGCERLLQFPGCLASAVEYLHSNKIRHKDLKPMNILLSRDGVRLADFDTSTDFSHLLNSSTDNGARGTPNYFAPEVANYERNGRAADVFSLGCIFLEMFTVGFGGRLEHLQSLRPMKGHTFQENLDSLDSWLSYIESLTGGEDHPVLNIDEHPSGRMTFRDRSLLKLDQKFIRNLVAWMLSRDPQSRPTTPAVLKALRNSVVPGHNPSSLKARFYGSCCAHIEGRGKPEHKENDCSVAQKDNRGDHPFAKVVDSPDSITDPDNTLDGKPVTNDPYPRLDQVREMGEMTTATTKASSRQRNRDTPIFGAPRQTLGDAEKGREELRNRPRMRERSGEDGHDDGAGVLATMGRRRLADDGSASYDGPDQPPQNQPSHLRVIQHADVRDFARAPASVLPPINGPNTDHEVRETRRLGTQDEMLHEYSVNDLGSQLQSMPSSKTPFPPHNPSRGPSWPHAFSHAFSQAPSYSRTLPDISGLSITTSSIIHAEQFQFPSLHSVKTAPEDSPDPAQNEKPEPLEKSFWSTVGRLSQPVGPQSNEVTTPDETTQQASSGAAFTKPHTTETVVRASNAYNGHREEHTVPPQSLRSTDYQDLSPALAPRPPSLSHGGRNVTEPLLLPDPALEQSGVRPRHLVRASAHTLNSGKHACFNDIKSITIKTIPFRLQKAWCYVLPYWQGNALKRLFEPSNLQIRSSRFYGRSQLGTVILPPLW